MSRQRFRPTVLSAVFLVSWIASIVNSAEVNPAVLNACPGYRATNVKTQANGLSAQLQLAGTACNVFGSDLPTLSLNVVYETVDRIHVKIVDATSQRYEVPESVVPRPNATLGVISKSANIQFEYTTSPFTFAVKRKQTGEVLFTTANNPIIFEPQYLRVKTSLPNSPNIYGLGEHTDPFRLPPENTTRTLWSRDAYGIPQGTNLYGNHPIYYEHRTTGTHGVLLLSSNGMDIKLSNDASSGYSLEYNVIGGVLDFYFLAGSTSDPAAVARQYAQVAGLPAEVPYWSFGLHQCRFGYKDYIDVAGVISNYSAAGIPLETMWTDIDYMDRRRIFTVDPVYFPLNRMREIVQYLHSHDQHFVLMTDPAVGVITDNYGPYTRGKALDIWLKAANGSDELGLVWPGVTVFPDWFHPKIAEYWNGEFQSFYSPDTGLDIDGAWIDMNEPSSFCDLPCDDPWAQAVQQDLPPPRTNPPPPPDAPIFVNGKNLQRRDGLDLLDPPYKINNAAPGGQLSSKTASSNAKHANGLVEYDTHNLYGTMMSVATRDAMLSRRPGKRTLVITRSTFVGAGAHVGKWLGDNMSQWAHYRFSIAGMLGFASVYQLPMVGSDICGYAGNTTESLCARWATLGSFYPFMRNHNDDVSISQEFYRWPTVAAAAKNGVDMRYRLLDYIYTAFHQAHVDGTPVLNPLWFKYPTDQATFSIDLQFFFGDSILVSPVTDENSTSVSIYLPRDIFYDFKTLAPIQGQGSTVQLKNVNFTEIPVHIKGGAVLPLRAKSQMTTAELRKTDFELVVAPGIDGQASGQLYFDDGESIDNPTSTNVKFSFSSGKLNVSGSFGFALGVKVARVKFLNVHEAPSMVKTDRGTLHPSQFSYDPTTKMLTVTTALDFTHGFSLQYT
ncbi:glycoside hydrolase family 31 protein [Cyathus striatus]|nr:glycoside hydrolase family 31 protein [Cyathus striatus]